MVLSALRFITPFSAFTTFELSEEELPIPTEYEVLMFICPLLVISADFSVSADKYIPALTPLSFKLLAATVIMLLLIAEPCVVSTLIAEVLEVSVIIVPLLTACSLPLEVLEETVGDLVSITCWLMVKVKLSPTVPPEVEELEEPEELDWFEAVGLY